MLEQALVCLFKLTFLGTRVCHLAALLKNKGHIYAFEHRPSKLESLKLKLKLMNVKSKGE
jgi:16S rRNA C967 or C1407 C5-methylase (RsmB/RsmF family)